MAVGRGKTTGYGRGKDNVDNQEKDEEHDEKTAVGRGKKMGSGRGKDNVGNQEKNGEHDEKKETRKKEREQRIVASYIALFIVDWFLDPICKKDGLSPRTPRFKSLVDAVRGGSNNSKMLATLDDKPGEVEFRNVKFFNSERLRILTATAGDKPTGGVSNIDERDCVHSLGTDFLGTCDLLMSCIFMATRALPTNTWSST